MIVESGSLAWDFLVLMVINTAIGAVVGFLIYRDATMRQLDRPERWGLGVGISFLFFVLPGIILGVIYLFRRRGTSLVQ